MNESEKGVLALSVQLELPPLAGNLERSGDYADTWKSLNNVWTTEIVRVRAVECTREEGAIIAEKFKAKNGGRTLAVWTGPQVL